MKSSLKLAPLFAAAAPAYLYAGIQFSNIATALPQKLANGRDTTTAAEIAVTVPGVAFVLVGTTCAVLFILCLIDTLRPFNDAKPAASQSYR